MATKVRGIFEDNKTFLTANNDYFAIETTKLNNPIKCE